MGAVDAEQVGVDQPGLVQPQLQPLDDAVEQPALTHLVEAVVNGLPGAVALGQVALGGAGVQPPEDTVEHQAVVLPLSPALAWAGWEKVAQLRPLGVGEFVSFGHQGSCVTAGNGCPLPL